MSPGSSSHSWLGAKSRSIFSGTSSRQARRARPGRRASAGGPRPAAGRRRRNRGAGRRRRRRSRTRPSRRRGGHRRRSGSARSSAVRRVVVQVDALHEQGPAGLRDSGGSARRASGPLRSVQRSPSLTIRRDSTSLRAASANSAPAIEPRQRHRRPRRAPAAAFFCQCRRMNSAAERPPSKRQSAGRDPCGHCAMIVRCRSPPLVSSA